MGLINLDIDFRVGKQIFNIFMDNIYTTKSTILKYTQNFSSVVYSAHTLHIWYMHTDRETDTYTDTYTHVSLTQMVMETLIYSIKKVHVFIVNQRKSCGLSNLVESQGTCNKKKSGKNS